MDRLSGSEKGEDQKMVRGQWSDSPLLVAGGEERKKGEEREKGMN